MKISINTDAISQDFETAVLLGIEWGVEYFELKRMNGKRVPDISEDEVRLVEKVLFENEVQLSSLAPGLFKIPMEKELIDKEINEKFYKTIQLADRLETRSVVIFGFLRDNIRSESEALDQIVDIFGSLAAKASLEGITLFLENDRGLWADNPSSLCRILGGVNSTALKLNWDPCNLVGSIPGTPFPDGYELVRNHVGHLHIKDAKSSGTQSIFTHAMVGNGDIDWVGQFEALLINGFDGFGVIEPHFGSRVESSRSHIIETKRLLRKAESRMLNNAIRR